MWEAAKPPVNQAFRLPVIRVHLIHFEAKNPWCTAIFCRLSETFLPQNAAEFWGGYHGVATIRRRAAQIELNQPHQRLKIRASVPELQQVIAEDAKPPHPVCSDYGWTCLASNPAQGTKRMQLRGKRPNLRRVLRILGGYAGALAFASLMCATYALYDAHRLSSHVDSTFLARPVEAIYYITSNIILDAVLHSVVLFVVFIVLSEVKAIKHAGFYAMAGAVTGVVAWLTFYPRLMKPTLFEFESYLVLGAIAGTGAGLVYWWIAGRKAGEAGQA